MRLRRCAIGFANTRNLRGYVLTALRAYTALFVIAVKITNQMHR